MLSITVIGAGIAGLWQACSLAKAGFAVRLLEQGDETLSGGCSWRAGGMLAPYCEAEVAEPLVVRLGLRSLELWRNWLPAFSQNGSLVVAPSRDPASLQRFGRLTQGYETLDGAAIARLEPALAGRFNGALYYPTEAHVDPRQALPRLLREARELGVETVFHRSAKLSDVDSDWGIDCRGLAAQDAWPELRGVKGEMILVKSADVRLQRPVRLLHHRHPIYVVPRDEGIFMIGATSLESESRGGVSVRSAGELLTQAYSLHPAFAEAEILELNAGLRPAFPDHLPRILSRGRHLFVNGLYRHGFLLSPALAEQVVQYLRRGAVEPELFHEY
ncbi:MAG: glycine oxidase ThiO [Gammaproteobacteria bacterium]|nr:glycine oxidase ThiO [Gammaproteobacteria bacterium]MCP5459953.1 glycine oxidase ThiO [Gammaproteobacteria bacterium]